VINTDRWLDRVAFSVATIAVAVVTFPGEYLAGESGLDPSWIWGLNAFSRSGIRFGRDLIFTYGPLGYLVRPLAVGENLALGNAVRLGVHAAIFICLLVLVRRRPSRSGAAMFLVGFLGLAVFAPEFDYSLLVAAAFALALAIELRSSIIAGIAAVPCALLAYMKFGNGVAAFAMVLTAGVLWAWRWRTMRGPVALLGAYLATFVCTARPFFGSYQGLLAYLGLSLQITRGFNAAMSTDGPPVAVYGGLGVLCGFLGVGALLTRRRVGAGTVLQLLALPMLIAFKHSFVRQDWGHEPAVFGLALAASVFGLPFAGTSSDRRWLGLVGVATAVTFACTADPKAVGVRRDALVAVIGGERARTNIEALLHWSGTLTRLEEASRAALSTRDALPAGLVNRIGPSSVLVVPWEIALCPANALTCVPYPTLQMYSTYTATLDRWSADRIAARSPDFVIAEVADIDGRNMVWDCPETWLALIRGWEVVDAARQPGRLLLGRRPAVLSISEMVLGRTRARLGDWSPAPPLGGRARLRIDVRSTVLGTLRRTLFREGPVVLDVSWADGRQSSFRLVTETARTGILVSPVVTSVGELRSLFDEAVTSPAPRAVRIRAGGGGWWKRDVEFTWVSVTLGQQQEVR